MTEFFTDEELASTKKALALVVRELEILLERTHDFSKQRLRRRIVGIQADLTVIARTLPEEG